MLTRFPSSTPLGLDLGTDCPAADEPGRGTLRLSVRGILTLVLAYSFRHPHFPALHRPLPDGFSALGTLPYRLKTKVLKPVASAVDLKSRPLSAQARWTGELLRTLSRYGCF